MICCLTFKSSKSLITRLKYARKITQRKFGRHCLIHRLSFAKNILILTFLKTRLRFSFLSTVKLCKTWHQIARLSTRFTCFKQNTTTWTWVAKWQRLSLRFWKICRTWSTSCICQPTSFKLHWEDSLKKTITTNWAVTGLTGTAKLADTPLITGRNRFISSAVIATIKNVWCVRSRWHVWRVCWVSLIKFSITWILSTLNIRRSRRSMICSRNWRIKRWKCEKCSR